MTDTTKEFLLNWIEAMRIITSRVPDLGMAHPEYFRGYQKGCKVILDTLELDLMRRSEVTLKLREVRD